MQCSYLVYIQFINSVISVLYLQLSEGTCFLPTENEPVNTPDGPITPVPIGIRPVMRKHRIEVHTELFLAIYQTRDTVFQHKSETEKRVENTTRSGVFLTNFEVFDIVMKHCDEFLI